jgi:hypothetical protein
VLAGEQVLLFALSLFAIMGVVDGLIYKRVTFQYQGDKQVYTGRWAQTIGWLSVVLAVVCLGILGLYILTLTLYCEQSVVCYVSMPFRSIFFAWPVPIGYLGLTMIFVIWGRLRRKGLDFVPITPFPSTPSSASLESLVNERLGAAHQSPMNRQQLQNLYDKIETLVSLVLLRSRKSVTKDGLIDPERVATVILATSDYLDKGKQLEIAVRVIVEEQVRAFNEHARRRRRRRQKSS